MNVIICDDEPVCAAAVQQAVSAWASGCKVGHAVNVIVFHSSEELMERFEAGLRIDALFTDIQFQDEENGLRIVRNIHLRDPNLPVVFISDDGKYVYEGYAVNALRFLKKPVSQAEIDECMEIIWRRYSLSHQDTVLIETQSQALRLPADSILSVEALGHTVRIKTTDEVGEYTVRKRLQEMLALLPPGFFVRCHRSYIVNILYVRRFTRQELLLSNGDRIPVGRTFRSECRRLFLEYCREESSS